MSVLLKIASSGTSNQDENTEVSIIIIIIIILSLHQSNQTAAIHSINILRGLIRESKLGEAVVPFISSSLMIALEGFSSKSWPVRVQYAVFQPSLCLSLSLSLVRFVILVLCCSVL